LNFYKHHLGDYAKKTAALSVTQHGAYLLMLHHFYATEEPLPVGRDLYRLLRADSKPERDAIDFIVAKFWRQEEGGLVNDRALIEIQAAEHQRSVNKEVGKLGGNPYLKAQYNEPGFLYAAAVGPGRIKVGITANISKRMYGLSKSVGVRVELVHSVPVQDMGKCEATLLAKFSHVADGEVLQLPDESRGELIEAMDSFRQPNGVAIASPSQTPDSRLQKRAEARATRFALASVPDEWVNFCKQERPDLDPARTFAKFGDYWRGKGGQAGRKLDWLATWRNWVREERGPTGRLPDAPKGSAAFKDWKPEVVAVAVKDDPAYKQLLSKMRAA
jgi:uncharacterized protein YdaU (DUF1376 family)